MVGAALHHFGHMLCLLIDRHRSDHTARGGQRGQLDLYGTGLGNLTVQLLQQGRVLESERHRRHKRGIPLHLIQSNTTDSIMPLGNTKSVLVIYLWYVL